MVSKKEAPMLCWFCSNIQCSESVGLLRLQHEPFHAIVATYRTDCELVLRLQHIGFDIAYAAK